MADSLRYRQQLDDKTDMIYSGGHVHYLFDAYTFTVAAGLVPITINFAKAPAGKLIVLPHLSRINSTAGLATCDLNVGYAAHTNGNTGLTVAADIDYFIVDADAGAIINTFWNLITGVTAAGTEPSTFNTRDGFQLTATFRTADMSIGDSITVTMAYLLNR